MIVSNINDRRKASGIAGRIVNQVRFILPEGRSLPDDVWKRRHLGIIVLLWLHVVGIAFYALLTSQDLDHILTETAFVACCALLAARKRLSRRVRATIASLGLVTSSALLVHFSGGYIEFHFHFFVMVVVISLYQDWIPFLLTIGYVLVHHGVVGVLDPRSVYNHPDAWAHPWEWAAIHALFIAGISIASIINWRMNEAARAHAELILGAVGEGIYGIDAQGNTVFVNPAAASLLGRKVEEMIGAPLHDILTGATPNGTGCSLDNCPIHSTLQNGTVHHVVDQVFSRKDGASFPVEYRSTPVLEHGKIAGGVITFTDISESRHAEDAQRSARDMRALYDISLLISSCLSVDEVIERIGTSIDTLINPDSYYIALYDAGSESVSFQFFTMMEPGEERSKHPMKMTKPLSEGGLTAYIIKSHQPVLIQDALAESSRYEAMLAFVGVSKPIITAGVRMRSILSVPMLWQDKVIGVISAQRVQPDALDTRDQRLFEAMAAQTTIALENARLHKLAQDQAQLDSLTQVYNHGHFIHLVNQAVDRAKEEGSAVSLIMLDVDHFKSYNDTHGHIVGDTVLKMVADALKTGARGVDFVGRWGGEEFGLLLPGTDMSEATKIARRVRRAIAEVTAVDGQGNPIPEPTVSQGISSYPNPSLSSSSLIEQADTALYHAKQTGRNKTALFEATGVLKTVPLVTAPLQPSK